jgi:hypothetical protein
MKLDDQATIENIDNSDQIRPKERSSCVEQIADLHKTLGTSFLSRWNPEPLGPITRLKKPKCSTFSDPVSRHGREIPQMDLIDGLCIRRSSAGVD